MVESLPLTLSVKNNNLDMAKLLLKYGAKDANNVGRFGEIENDSTALTDSAMKGKFEYVKTILSSIKYSESYQEYVWFALCEAVTAGYVEIVEYILKQGVRVNFCPANHYNSADKRDILSKVLKQILRYKAYTIFENYNQIFTESPSYFRSKALQKIYTPIIKLLLSKGAKVESALSIAIEEKVDWFIELIIKHSPKIELNRLINFKLTKLKNKKNSTYNASISIEEKLEVLKVLLRKLMYSKYEFIRDLEANLRINDLFKSCAREDPHKLQDSINELLFDLVIENIGREWSSKAAKLLEFRLTLLLKYGFDWSKYNGNGKNALVKLSDISNNLIRYRALKLLLYTGAKDVFIGLKGSISADYPLSALANEVCRNNLKNFLLLIKYNNYKNQKDLINDALFLAAVRGRDIMVEILLKLGANPNASSDHNILFNATKDFKWANHTLTAQMMAQYYGCAISSDQQYKSVVESLIKYGANVDEMLYVWIHWDVPWAIELVKKYHNLKINQLKFAYVKELHEKFKVEYYSIKENKDAQSKALLSKAIANKVEVLNKLHEIINQEKTYGIVNSFVDDGLRAINGLFDMLKKYYFAFQKDNFDNDFGIIKNTILRDFDKLRQAIMILEYQDKPNQRDNIDILTQRIIKNLCNFSKMIEIILPCDSRNNILTIDGIVNKYAHHEQLLAIFNIIQIVCLMSKSEGKAII